MKKLLFLVMALVCISWSHAYADYIFTFTDTTNLDNYDVTGTLNTSLNADGTSYTVIAGSVTGTGLQNSGIVYTLVPNPNAPGYNVASGFQYDDQLFPSLDPILNSNGLLFQSADSVINIWGDGIGVYELYQYTPFVDDQGTDTLTSVPEPSTVLLLGIGLAGLIAGARVSRRRKVSDLAS